MQHKGEIVEKAIRESGYSLTHMAKKLNRSRRWMYLLFENPNVSLDLIIQIGKIIHYDFSDEIKELKKYKLQDPEQFVNESAANYKKTSEESEHWKNKYLELLEKHNQLLLQIANISKTSKKKKKT